MVAHLRWAGAHNTSLITLRVASIVLDRSLVTMIQQFEGTVRDRNLSTDAMKCLLYISCHVKSCTRAPFTLWGVCNNSNQSRKFIAALYDVRRSVQCVGIMKVVQKLRSCMMYGVGHVLWSWS